MLLAAFPLPLFTNLLLLLLFAKVFGTFFERCKQPAMIGEILAGIMLGPSVLNVIHKTEDIKIISELGIFLLVILAGLEININDILKSLKGWNIIISILAFFLPLMGGIGVGYYYNQDILTCIFVGLCVAITALPVSIRILLDLGKLNTDVGQKIIAIAIFDDVLALTILGVLLNLHASDGSATAASAVVTMSLLKLLLFVGMLGVAYMLITYYLKKGNYLATQIDKLVIIMKGKGGLFTILFVFVLLFAAFTDYLGFHFIVGTFFASMLISTALIGKENFKAIETTTSNMAMGFLAPIFFAGIGLEFNITSIGNIGFLVAVVLVSYLSKIAGGYFGGVLAGLSHRVSWTLGVGLNARGIMELVIANIAFKKGLINTQVFSILVIMGVLTTITTPVLLKKAFRRME